MPERVCLSCGGVLADHLDTVTEGPYGEEIHGYSCLVDDLDDVLHDMEEGEPPAESEWLVVIRAVRKAYQRRVRGGHTAPLRTGGGDGSAQPVELDRRLAWADRVYDDAVADLIAARSATIEACRNRDNLAAALEALTTTVRAEADILKQGGRYRGALVLRDACDRAERATASPTVGGDGAGVG